MKRRRLPILMILGIALIVAGFALFGILKLRMHTSAGKSEQIIDQMEQLLPNPTPGIPGDYSNPTMPVLEIDGTDYVAKLEIPAYGLELPVADQWNNRLFYDTPARFHGSVYDNTLVIGGGDYVHQFAFCSQIDLGVEIHVTDMIGTRYTFSVARIERGKRADWEWLTGSEYDLTLYCRDSYSMEYIAVRCNLD